MVLRPKGPGGFRVSTLGTHRPGDAVKGRCPGLNSAKLRRIIGDFAPKGLQDSAQGFNLILTLGTTKINEFALKGREADQIRLLRK